MAREDIGASGSRGCDLDTNGDGNCPVHPAGCPHETSDVVRMRNTLVQAGDTDCGGELWKPPLGPRPVFLDRLEALEGSVYGAIKWLLSYDPTNAIHARNILLSAIGMTQQEFSERYRDHIIQPPAQETSVSDPGSLPVQHPTPCWCPYCGEPHSPAVREITEKASVKRSVDSTPLTARHFQHCDCHDCQNAKKHPQIPHHALCGCWACKRTTV